MADLKPVSDAAAPAAPPAPAPASAHIKAIVVDAGAPNDIERQEALLKLLGNMPPLTDDQRAQMEAGSEMTKRIRDLR